MESRLYISGGFCCEFDKVGEATQSLLEHILSVRIIALWLFVMYSDA